METKTENAAVCCPPFDPGPWDDKVHHWEHKKFIKDNVFTLFYIPVNFGSVMRRLDRKVRAVGLSLGDTICLSDHRSKWRMDVYLSVDRVVPGTEVTEMTGDFYTRVYDGPYSDTGKWCADFESKAREKGFNIGKMLMWHSTCPKCAKKYGKNYTTILSRIN